MERLDRGLRNHNPGNLEGNTPWQGAAGHDGPYIIFDTDADGLRALAINILNQQRLHKLNTVTQIIEKFAPPSENNTLAYIDAVCKHVGCKPAEVLDLDDPTILARFVQAVVAHENSGYAYAVNDVITAVSAALTPKPQEAPMSDLSHIAVIPEHSPVQNTATAVSSVALATGVIDYIVMVTHLPPMPVAIEGALAAALVTVVHAVYARLTK